ncbi:hypothetical protein [Azospirillum sp. B2RO_4]|uniref:hypothetical protein n=1 Tax=Azospirillum sp. B2RO_4 TaxID=3027796 RepID=UPI003DA86DC7
MGRVPTERQTIFQSKCAGFRRRLKRHRHRAAQSGVGLFRRFIDMKVGQVEERAISGANRQAPFVGEQAFAGFGVYAAYHIVVMPALVAFLFAGIALDNRPAPAFLTRFGPEPDLRET